MNRHGFDFSVEKVIESIADRLTNSEKEVTELKTELRDLKDIVKDLRLDLAILQRDSLKYEVRIKNLEDNVL